LCVAVQFVLPHADFSAAAELFRNHAQRPRPLAGLPLVFEVA
jgi:hypothetical protein